MKKVLSLSLTLMMLITMLCSIPVMAADPDGSAENPYYVTNPTMVPDFITIPANSTLYYQYNAMVFNGWEVGGYGLSAITVDGVVYDEPDMWGEIYAPLNFTMMSSGLVGYVNDTAEEIQVMLTHNEPLGTENNPAQMEDGDNAFSISANVMTYFAVYVPMANGEYTFSTEQFEDFIVTIDADGDNTDGNAVTLDGASLTLELESYVPVFVTISPVGMTGDMILTITPPAAGTEGNPIWMNSESVGSSYALDAATPLYFQISDELIGSVLNLESVAGANFTALVDGVEYASEDGVLSILLEGENWYVDLVLTSVVENEVMFLVDYAEGTEKNPIELFEGDNEISIPEGVFGYYYSFIVEKDGLLVITPSVYTMGYLSMADESYYDFAYLQEGSSNMMMPVTAGETIIIECYTAMDEETFEFMALEAILNLEVKDLVLYDSFEEGDLGNWASDSNLTSDDMDYASGFYSAKFEVTLDWGNVYNYINLEPNTDYTVSFKAKAALEKTLWVKFNKAWAFDVATAEVKLTTEWAEYEMVMNSGELGSAVLLLQYAGYGADGQTIWVDDFVITKVASDEPAVNYGDVDGNGKINNRDLGVMQLYLNSGDLTGKTFDELAADMDGNGKINNRDLGLLQKELNK